MSRHEQILERMRHTNPVQQLESITRSDLAFLDSLVDQRSSAVTDLKQPTFEQAPSDRGRGRWKRPTAAFGAGLIVVLGTIGMVALISPDNGSDVGSEPVAPTSAVQPDPTIGTPGPQVTVAPEADAPVPPTGTPFLGTWEGHAIGFHVRDVVESRFGLVVAAADRGVWISEDGAQWRQSLEVSFGTAAPQDTLDQDPVVASGPQESSTSTTTMPPANRVDSIVTAVAEFGSAVYAFGATWTDAQSAQGSLERFVWRSDDGDAWTRITLPATSVMQGAIHGAASAGGTLLAYLSVPNPADPDRMTTAVFLSEDGNVWTVMEGGDAGLDGIELSDIATVGTGFVGLGRDASAGVDPVAHPFGRQMVYTSTNGGDWEPVTGAESPAFAFTRDFALDAEDVLYVGGFEFDGDQQQPVVWKSTDLRTFERLDLGLTVPWGLVQGVVPSPRGLVVVGWSGFLEEGQERILPLLSVDDSTFAMLQDPHDVLAGSYPEAAVSYGDQILIFGQHGDDAYQWTWTPES